MLENIKMLLSLEDADTTKDSTINYWINYYTKMVLKYCHIDELTDGLEGMVEQIIVARMGGIGSKGDITKGGNTGIKSMSRGDYSVTYRDLVEDTKIYTQLDKYAIAFQGQLNLWRRLDY